MVDDDIRKIKDIPIIFIVGIGRSGTTLLQELLDSHTQIAAPPECDFVAYLYPKFGKIKSYSEQDIYKFIDALFSQPIIQTWLLNKEELTAKLIAAKHLLNYQVLCKMVFYQTRRDKSNIILFSDKFPEYSLFTKKLLKIFPEAKFVHIIRDPRDNANSRIKSLPYKNTFFNAWNWLGFNTSIEKVKYKYPAKFFTIKYEAMVQNVEETLKSLCTFLQVPYEDGMRHNKFAAKLNLYSNTNMYDVFKKIHHNMLQPVNTGNIGKWKIELSKRDQIIVEKITGGYAKLQYGYEIELDKMEYRKVSIYKLIKSKIIYIIWVFFTRLRFSNYWLNTIYKDRKLKPFREKHNLKK